MKLHNQKIALEISRLLVLLSRLLRLGSPEVLERANDDIEMVLYMKIALEISSLLVLVSRLNDAPEVVLCFKITLKILRLLVLLSRLYRLRMGLGSSKLLERVNDGLEVVLCLIALVEQIP